VLVVIAIIAILAALLFPTFATAKRKGKQTACVSNQKQVGNAFFLYCADYEEIYPYGLDAVDKWASDVWSFAPQWQQEIPKMPLIADILQLYAKSYEIFRCPADTGSLVLDDNYPHAFATSPSMWKMYKSSYLYRTELAFTHATITSIRKPAETALIADAMGHWHTAERPLDGQDPSELTRQYRDFRYVILFADLHAKFKTYPEIYTAWNVPQ